MSTPASGVSIPPPLPGVGQAGKGSQAELGQLGQFNTFGQTLPQAEGVGQSLFNNPYAGGLQAGANAAGPMLMQGGLNTFGSGNALFAGSSALMNQAFDPQQALYNRTAQQVQDQTRVGLEARGVDSTPYGAGVEGQTMSNFNIDWQNQQLQRMLQGLGGAGQGYGQASALQQQGGQQYAQGAGMPYQAFQGIGQGQMGALQGEGQFGQQAAVIPEFQQSQQQSYALGGQAQNINQANTALNQANLGWQQSMAPWSTLGQFAGMGLGGLAYGYGRGLGQGGSTG